MSGKIIGIGILICSLIAGAGLYYLQIYGFYHDVAPKEGVEVELVLLRGGQREAIAYGDFRAIDADSSPIRYRACFTTTHSNAMLSETYVMLDHKSPRNAPVWFDCFDARAIGDALQAGTARTYLGGKNVSYGVDRIVAILDDGRGFIWNDLNECGKKAYDGTVVGEECPPLDTVKFSD